MGDDALKEHLEKLDGLKVTGYTPEILTEAEISFTYKGFEFDVDNTHWEWQFWVYGNCSKKILDEIETHCTLLLGN